MLGTNKEKKAAAKKAKAEKVMREALEQIIQGGEVA